MGSCHWVGVIHADRAHGKIGVEGDAVEVGGRGKGNVDGDTGERDDDVALPLLGGATNCMS
jgi:hypothetical protein